ncbi:unnamed protein product [Heterobilharzia americana]|nr:unnamed protein product [Heterobilharzia americana]
MEENFHTLLGATVAYIGDMKKDMLKLSCGDEFPVNQITSEFSSSGEKSEVSFDAICSDLKNIKSSLSHTVNAFSSYSAQVKGVLADQLTLHDISSENCIQADQKFFHLLSHLAKGLQSGLFARIRELSTHSLSKNLSEFIDHYNELNMKYNELLIVSSEVPNKQLGLLEQTSVFELLEKEISNSAKEIESVRSSFESKLSAATADWEYERSKLMTELHRQAGVIEELRGTAEANETAHLLLKGELGRLAQEFCSKENVDVGPNSALNQLRSFLFKVVKKCPWIKDSLYGSNSEAYDSVLPNPIEQKKSLDKIILERNELEDECHQLKQKLLSLRDSHTELMNKLNVKNDELQLVLEKSRKLEGRIAHYREMINKLCDPKIATAFANNLRQNIPFSKADVHNNSSSASTLSVNLSNQINSSSTCLRSEQEGSLTTVSILSSNKTSETQSSSIFSRVGATVTAVANVITSPKRPHPAPESSCESKLIRPDHLAQKSNQIPYTIPVVGATGLGRCEDIPLLYDSVASKVPPPVISTRSHNFAIPDRPILSSSHETASGAMRSVALRKPLIELPVSKLKSPTASNPSDDFHLAFSSGSLAKKELAANGSDKGEDFRLKNLDSDFSFLQYEPLAESTSQIPQDVLRVVHACIKESSAYRRPEMVNHPTTVQPLNKKDDISPYSKAANPSPWQVPICEPSRQYSDFRFSILINRDRVSLNASIF